MDSAALSVAIMTLFLLGVVALLAWQLHRLRAERARAVLLERELAHATRFALAGQLGASVLQEIGQPLVAITAKVETAQLLLSQDGLRRSELQRVLPELRAEADRAGAMAQRLLALLARRDTGPEPFDAHQMIAEAACVLEAEAAHRRIDVILQPCAIVSRVNWDRLQLQQVVMQLLSNAMDAMEQTQAGLRRVVLSTRDVGEQLEIQVSDRGHGLGARHPETLFQPYYTTKSNGLGLGLSVARNIVRSHGGTIHARRRPGGGAVFTLALPRQATAAAALPRARSPVRLPFAAAL